MLMLQFLMLPDTHNFLDLNIDVYNVLEQYVLFFNNSERPKKLKPCKINMVYVFKNMSTNVTSYHQQKWL